MNTLGKILIVLIFVMSIFFMAFSFMVFMTHDSWKDKASQADRDLQQARNQNSQLEASIAEAKTQRQAENAARTTAIALLEARLQTDSQQLAETQGQLRTLQAKQSAMGEQVTGSLAALQMERQKVEGLRENVKSAQAERDKIFGEVVNLKNQVLELESIRQRLAAREQDLLEQLASAKAVLLANDLSEHDSVANIPPPTEGRVSEVRDNKLVLVTLGTDDGLRRGHTLNVHRGSKYLGKIQLTKMLKDRSVGKVLPDYQKGAIMRGDSVRTK